jgi:hypothetical protein
MSSYFDGLIVLPFFLLGFRCCFAGFLLIFFSSLHHDSQCICCVRSGLAPFRTQHSSTSMPRCALPYFTESKIGTADILPTPSGISCQVGHADLFSDSIAVPPKSGTKKLQFGSGNAGNFGGFKKMSRQLWLTLKIATSEKCNAALDLCGNANGQPQTRKVKSRFAGDPTGE